MSEKVILGQKPGEKDLIRFRKMEIRIKQFSREKREHAKLLLSINVLLQGGYFTALSFSDLATIRDELEGCGFTWEVKSVYCIFLISPVILWFMSMIFALRVLEPKFGEPILGEKTASTNLALSLNEEKFWTLLYNQYARIVSRDLRISQYVLIFGFLMLIINMYIYTILNSIPDIVNLF